MSDSVVHMRPMKSAADDDDNKEKSISAAFARIVFDPRLEQVFLPNDETTVRKVSSIELTRTPSSLCSLVSGGGFSMESNQKLWIGVLELSRLYLCYYGCFRYPNGVTSWCLCNVSGRVEETSRES